MIRKTGIFVLCVGIIAIIVAVVKMTYNLWDEARADKSASQIAQKLYEQIEPNKEKNDKNIILSTENVIQFEESASQIYEPYESESQTSTSETYFQLTESTTELVEINWQSYMGILNIPSLSLNLPINSEWSEYNLKDSPCRYKGDMINTMVIGGHDYKRHFGKISTLSNGESLIITDSKGTEYQYIVESISVLNDTDVDAIVNNSYCLTLFTCVLNDSTKRVVVRCKKVQAENSEIDYISDISEPNTSEVPNYKIDYKKETIKLKRGDLYSLDSGISFTEVTKAGGFTLDVSDFITNSIEIQIKKSATSKRLASKVQIITPLSREIMNNTTLSCTNGKVNLDTKKYEIYNPKTKKWGGMPRVTASGEFNIRLKSTVQETKTDIIGNAASIPGRIKFTYSVYDIAKNKSGIIEAEIIITE